MKDIQISENKIFRVKAVQLAGDFLDANGNPLDSGNSLVSIEPTDTTTLPEAEAIAAINAQ